MNAQRLARIDRAECLIELVLDRRDAEDEPTIIAPTPMKAPAVRTPEGYLRAKAWIARDGLLEYSDGTDTWIEYRPRFELEKAAIGWRYTPITDDHPSKMVDSSTFADVARGIHIGWPCLTEPQFDGISYLECEIQVMDAGLVTAIESGKKVELSIGFTALVVPCETGVAPDGTPCAALQLNLEPNHTAVVERGRAGPAVRVFLDGAEQLVPSSRPVVKPVAAATTGDAMTIKNKRGAPAPGGQRRDEVGSPASMVKVKLPSGSEYDLPTEVAAMLQQLMGGQAPAPAPAAAPAPASSMPAAPADAMAGGAPPAPAPAAPAPPKPEEEKPMGDSEKEPEEVKDAAAAYRRRARLERYGARVGLDDKVLDAEDKDIAKAIVGKAMPHLVGKLDSMSMPQLDALVEAAVSMPAPTSARTDAARANPVLYVQPQPTAIGDSDDEESEVSESVLNYFASQGY